MWLGYCTGRWCSNAFKTCGKARYAVGVEVMGAKERPRDPRFTSKKLSGLAADAAHACRGKLVQALENEQLSLGSEP